LFAKSKTEKMDSSQQLGIGKDFCRTESLKHDFLAEIGYDLFDKVDDNISSSASLNFPDDTLSEAMDSCLALRDETALVEMSTASQQHHGCYRYLLQQQMQVASVASSGPQPFLHGNGSSAKASERSRSTSSLSSSLTSSPLMPQLPLFHQVQVGYYLPAPPAQPLTFPGYCYIKREGSTVKDFSSISPLREVISSSSSSSFDDKSSGTASLRNNRDSCGKVDVNCREVRSQRHSLVKSQLVPLPLSPPLTTSTPPLHQQKQRSVSAVLDVLMERFLLVFISSSVSDIYSFLSSTCDPIVAFHINTTVIPVSLDHPAMCTNFHGAFLFWILLSGLHYDCSIKVIEKRSTGRCSPQVSLSADLSFFSPSAGRSPSFGTSAGRSSFSGSRPCGKSIRPCSRLSLSPQLSSSPSPSYTLDNVISMEYVVKMSGTLLSLKGLKETLSDFHVMGMFHIPLVSQYVPYPPASSVSPVVAGSPFPFEFSQRFRSPTMMSRISESPSTQRFHPYASYSAASEFQTPSLVVLHHTTSQMHRFNSVSSSSAGDRFFEFEKEPPPQLPQLPLEQLQFINATITSYLTHQRVGLVDMKDEHLTSDYILEFKIDFNMKTGKIMDWKIDLLAEKCTAVSLASSSSSSSLPSTLSSRGHPNLSSFSFIW
jgi:hypothetical protein